MLVSWDHVGLGWCWLGGNQTLFPLFTFHLKIIKRFPMMMIGWVLGLVFKRKFEFRFRYLVIIHLHDIVSLPLYKHWRVRAFSHHVWDVAKENRNFSSNINDWYITATIIIYSLFLARFVTFQTLRNDFLGKFILYFFVPFCCFCSKLTCFFLLPPRQAVFFLCLFLLFAVVLLNLDIFLQTYKSLDFACAYCFVFFLSFCYFSFCKMW